MNVRYQYEKWPFPGVGILSREGLQFLMSMRTCLGRTPADNGPVGGVIDVGCGTGDTVIALAKHFPSHRFLGVDFSRESLRRALRTRDRLGVGNVDFIHTDLRKAVRGLGTFRVVLCAGVIHHLESPAQAFRRVVSLVAPGGYLFVWLYGSHGRTPHALNQDLLRMLGKGRSRAERVRIAREFVRTMEPYIVNTGFYTPRGSGAEGIRWLLDHPQWLVDQMIPECEHRVTMEEVLTLFRKSRLEIVKWLGGPGTLPGGSSSDLLHRAFRRLSAEERLIALDHLVKPPYYFVLGRKQREGRRR